MTPETLARIQAAIEADAAALETWGDRGIIRARQERYLALARAVVAWVQADIDVGAIWPEGDDFADTETRAIYAALAALAADTETGDGT